MRIVYLINVDWFFVSHFLHLAQRARKLDYDVVLATNVSGLSNPLENGGLEVVALPSERGGISLSNLMRSIRIVTTALRLAPGTIIHGFGLFGIVIGTLAGVLSPQTRRVFTITGRGYTAVSPTVAAWVLNACVGLFCRYVADSKMTRWIAENRSDIAGSRLDHAFAEGRAVVVGGAGVDIDHFVVAPMPERPPFKCGLVARMIWSKGVDVAVEAVRLAREKGLDVELTLAGPLDDDNPRTLTAAAMRSYEAMPGVRWLGRIDDINRFWSTQHLAILPSRGGEGVPRSLIEAAACGRPILSTTVPGCQEFAKATNGWSVPPNDPSRLAATLIEIAESSGLSKRGAFGRQIVGENYSEQKLWDTVHKLYCDLSKVDSAGAPTNEAGS